jgi:hypothetical protein
MERLASAGWFTFGVLQRFYFYVVPYLMLQPPDLLQTLGWPVLVPDLVVYGVSGLGLFAAAAGTYHDQRGKRLVLEKARFSESERAQAQAAYDSLIATLRTRLAELDEISDGQWLGHFGAPARKDEWEARIEAFVGQKAMTAVKRWDQPFVGSFEIACAARQSASSTLYLAKERLQRTSEQLSKLRDGTPTTTREPERRLPRLRRSTRHTPKAARR